MSLDLDLGEPRYARAARTGEPPEKIVDRAWAKDLLGQCIAELAGKPSHLQAFDLQMRGADYVTIGKATGLTETENRLTTALASSRAALEARTQQREECEARGALLAAELAELLADHSGTTSVTGLVELHRATVRVLEAAHEALTARERTAGQAAGHRA